jgi:enoyl reductase
MQAMMRRISIASVILAGLVAPLLTAGPATAGSGVPGCTGNDCSIQLSDLIHLKGDHGSGRGHVPVDVPPPPCLWEPIGDQVSGSNAIVDEWGNDPPTSFGVDKSVAQAKDLLKNPVDGEWYELPVNPAASEAGKQECLKLPLYFFAQPGAPLPTPPIPPRTLAALAYNHMTIPDPDLRISPAAKGYVNLGSYVWGTWADSQLTNRPDAYGVTASLGGVTVTVWAQVAAHGAFAVSANGPGTSYSAGCGAGGSQFPVGDAPASAGAGTPPDCGVLWRGPDATAGITATVTWKVSWGNGELDGPGPNALPDITTVGQSANIAVGEIQSVNGG